MKKRTLVAVLTMILLLSCLLAVTQAASASRPSTVVTNTNDSGPGSLRYVIADAFDGDTITFNLSGSKVITLNSVLSINKNLTIEADGVELRLNTTGYRHINVTSGNLTLKGATLTGLGSEGAANGGIKASTPLTLTNCIIKDCYTTGMGGAVYTEGGATLTGCQILDNKANNWGGGVEGYYSAITAIDCIFSGNSGSLGGAIDTSGNVTLTNCTVSDNSATTNGGGIYAYTANLTNCTISGNTANYGGGVRVSNSTSLTLKGSIIAGNYNFSGIANEVFINTGSSYPTTDGEVESGTYGEYYIIGTGADLSNLLETETKTINGHSCMVGKLDDNTMTIKPTSALYVIPYATLSGWGVTTDQRGVTRSSTELGAIGAFQIASAKPAPADKTPLKELVESTKEIKASAKAGSGNGQYPQTEIDNLQAAIEAAQKVADNYNPSQGTINSAIKALQKAIDQFNASKTTVSFYDLNEAIENAERRTQGSYTDSTWNALQAAIANGKNISDSATQTAVDAATEAIAQAIASLAVKPIPSTTIDNGGISPWVYVTIAISVLAIAGIVFFVLKKE